MPALRDEMVQAAFATSRVDTTLFDALLEARARHGGGHRSPTTCSSSR
jgi:hypothetical protein